MNISAEEKNRYLREAEVVLAREGFLTDRTHAGSLRVLFDGAPLCEVPESGGVTYRMADVSTPERIAAKDKVYSIVRAVAEYNPTLDKTVREAKNSTGKNTGSLTDTKDGYTHTATASVGDTVDYQIISILPTITSKASALSEYTYADTLSKGIKYNKNDVVIEFFRDAGCTEKVATWAENSGKFAVA